MKNDVNRRHCDRYVGLACIDGSCPISLSDEYAERGYDMVKNCAECHYYKGCEDCYFCGKNECLKKGVNNESI